MDRCPPAEHRPSDPPSLWLVRHGQSTWNARHLIQGHDDTSFLTPTGQRQALEVADLLGQHDIGAIYSSDLRRARQTATPLARHLGLAVTVDARLRERAFGVLEGRPAADLDPASSGLDDDAVIDADARADGGESVRELFGRTTAFLADLRPPAHGDVVLFVHGGSLRTLLAARTGVAVERLGWGPVRNATVVHVPLAPRPPSAETPRHVLTATN